MAKSPEPWTIGKTRTAGADPEEVVGGGSGGIHRTSPQCAVLSIRADSMSPMSCNTTPAGAEHDPGPADPPAELDRGRSATDRQPGRPRGRPRPPGRRGRRGIPNPPRTGISGRPATGVGPGTTRFPDHRRQPTPGPAQAMKTVATAQARNPGSDTSRPNPGCGDRSLQDDLPHGRSTRGQASPRQSAGAIALGSSARGREKDGNDRDRDHRRIQPHPEGAKARSPVSKRTSHQPCSAPLAQRGDDLLEVEHETRQDVLARRASPDCTNVSTLRPGR